MVANVKYYSLPLQICVVCLTSAKNNDQCFFEVIHLESRWIHHLLSKGYSQNLAHNCHDHVNWKTKQNSTVFYNIPMIFDVKKGLKYIEMGITFLDFDLLSNKSMQLSTHSNTSNTQQIFLLLYIKAPFICIYDMTWFAFTDFKIFISSFLPVINKYRVLKDNLMWAAASMQSMRWEEFRFKSVRNSDEAIVQMPTITK